MVLAVAADDDERLRRQRTRSVAIALTLGALVLLFYAATIVRLGPNALRKGQLGVPSGSIVVPDKPAPDGSKAGK